MSKELEIFIPLSASDESIASLVARAAGSSPSDLGTVRVVRRSLDARKGHPIGYRVRVRIFPTGSEDNSARAPVSTRAWPSSVPRPRVVIVGSGPAGLWAALRLAESGVPSTIVERGKPVQPRRHDLASIQRGRLNPESNYCFGEGGAGTYSDGKLYTRAKDRAGVDRVLSDLVRFGAPDEVTVESRPHVGSNRLPKVVSTLRAHLENHGVSYKFECALKAIDCANGRVTGVRTSDGDSVAADVVILATGHSARDVYAIAERSGILLERKGSAIGLRLEHPQSVIDRIQYGSAAGHPQLPSAFYEVSATGQGRGVYSFCMCPGGFIVPSATEPDALVVNGMSLSRRDSPFANAAMVVALGPDDYGAASLGPLAGIALQRRIEESAYRAGGGAFRAPAQRLGDFLAGKDSTSLPKSSYHPGIVGGRVDDVFPAPIASALRDGLAGITHRMRGFLHPDAVLIGAETRTSAPVRIVRDKTTLQSPTLQGLYPAGEGAGYAGGIVSAALDGARIAEAILDRAR
jgi:uncharacterized FAD-dependent dehydrogenase